jgi:hypothetical protein
MQDRISSITESYEKRDAFPLLTDRLNSVQRFILRQQPNRWKALWNDTRDLTRWYTLWAVAIFGTISILLSVIQVGIGVAQIFAAYQGLKLTQIQINQAQNQSQ